MNKTLHIFLLLAMLAIATPSLRAQQLFIERSDLAASEVDATYVKGLQFLLKNQSPEGRWSDQPYGAEPGVCGLAVVAMLAHGDDPNVGPYSVAIRKGLDFILSQMNKDTGYIGRSMYNHGFATLALAEAYGMVDDDRIGPAMEKAVNLIISSQKANSFGAWRYSPESLDADTTVSGAQVVALFAARNAGMSVPEEAIQKALDYFKKCQTPEGGFGYTSAVGPNGARTAIGCLAFSLAKSKNSPNYQQAYAFLKTAPGEAHYNHYYL
ncbi:MAG: squalene-hopene cyclase-like protein [Verrucomicrobia bacterium]|jgi:prenyltransferase beta subunit|nr:squalene-hopene cyclase-like protein [Verrucomicrobiota bacterium]